MSSTKFAGWLDVDMGLSKLPRGLSIFVFPACIHRDGRGDENERDHLQRQPRKLDRSGEQEAIAWWKGFHYSFELFSTILYRHPRERQAFEHHGDLYIFEKD